jgi:hypothetical protein
MLGNDRPQDSTVGTVVLPFAKVAMRKSIWAIDPQSMKLGARGNSLATVVGTKLVLNAGRNLSRRIGIIILPAGSLDLIDLSLERKPESLPAVLFPGPWILKNSSLPESSISGMSTKGNIPENNFLGFFRSAQSNILSQSVLNSAKGMIKCLVKTVKVLEI